MSNIDGRDPLDKLLIGDMARKQNKVLRGMRKLENGSLLFQIPETTEEYDAVHDTACKRLDTDSVNTTTVTRQGKKYLLATKSTHVKN